ncbi:MAG: mechanosensitive ion channel family protein [Pseudomonadota bacterium]
MEFIDLMTNGYVPAYVAAIFGSQVLFAIGQRLFSQRRLQKRLASGLPADELIVTASKLKALRWATGVQMLLFACAVVGVPLLFILVTGERHAAVVFVALLAMISIQVPEPIKYSVGGLAFKSLVAANAPFQIGDRVCLRGIKGRVTGVGMFYITLQTPDDDKVSIPTYALWTETLSSTNAGDMGSLSVATVYLSPRCEAACLSKAEGALAEAIHASPYLDISRPVDILVGQTSTAITITAKAYVASTYDEPHFVSDTLRAFLKSANEYGIQLAQFETEMSS